MDDMEWILEPKWSRRDVWKLTSLQHFYQCDRYPIITTQDSTRLRETRNNNNSQQKALFTMRFRARQIDYRSKEIERVLAERELEERPTIRLPTNDDVHDEDSSVSSLESVYNTIETSEQAIFMKDVVDTDNQVCGERMNVVLF